MSLARNFSIQHLRRISRLRTVVSGQLPTGPVIQDGTFDTPPTVQNVSGTVSIQGKKSTGAGKFIYPLTLAASTTYTIRYDPDFTQLSNTGKDAMVGFGFRVSGNGAYHLAGLKGDGSTGLDATKVTGTNFTTGAGTVSVQNTADHGTQAGPNYLRLSTSADLTTYTLETSTNGSSWTTEIANAALSLTAADFGIAAYFPATDVGLFTIGITVYTAAATVAATTMAKPVLYSGTGGTNAVTGVGFQPDAVFVKRRNSAIDPWRLIDAVRGVGLALEPDDMSAEVSEATGLTAFGADGFTLGASNVYNINGGTFLALCLKRISQAFDIVTYTGTGVAKTVAHSLGAVPELMIIKNRTVGSPNLWAVYPGPLASPAGRYLHLDVTNAAATASASTVWNSTEPTSSVFSVGTAGAVNANASNHVAYLFASKAGISKVGTYTGNGSTTGPTVTTGFRPKILIIKRTDNTGNWHVIDSARDATSPHATYFNMDTGDGDLTATNGVAFTDTTFQIVDATFGNANGGTYLYLALA